MPITNYESICTHLDKAISALQEGDTNTARSELSDAALKAYPGETDVSERAELASTIAGFLTRFHVNVGKLVPDIQKLVKKISGATSEKSEPADPIVVTAENTNGY